MAGELDREELVEQVDGVFTWGSLKANGAVWVVFGGLVVVLGLVVLLLA